MAVDVRATKRAELQLGLITDYLNAQNPAAARGLEVRLSEAYRQLSAFPLSGTRGQAGTRRLTVRPYVLTYRVTATGVEILDIRHGRQRPIAFTEEA